MANCVTLLFLGNLTSIKKTFMTVIYLYSPYMQLFSLSSNQLQTHNTILQWKMLEQHANRPQKCILMENDGNSFFNIMDTCGRPSHNFHATIL